MKHLIILIVGIVRYTQMITKLTITQRALMPKEARKNMPKINQEEYEVLKPKLEEEYTHVGKSRDGKLQFLQEYIERDMKREEWSDGWGQTYMRPVNLFQFIQWEDEEPYNIAELIEEYESEETEVKKDKEWFFQQVINAINKSELGSISMTSAERILGLMESLLNQLDEPEVLSQEWIDKNKTSIDRKLDGTPIYKVREELLQNLLVPKQKLPVIPKFVADYIDNRKEVGFPIYQAIRIVRENSRFEHSHLREWLWTNKGQETFVRAWLDGYEVEKEQKYNVNFKFKSSFGTVGTFLYKEGDEVLAGDNFRVYYPKEEEYMLTEQEIRGFQNGDVLFEHFAVKVEELEEC